MICLSKVNPAVPSEICLAAVVSCYQPYMKTAKHMNPCLLYTSVKPAMSYLDMVRAIKDLTDVPMAAYSVSGEYAMVKAAAKLGYVDEAAILCEMAACAYRAGVDIYMSYYAKEIAHFMDEGRIG